MYVLSTIEQRLLSDRERQEILSRLASYQIPLQILELVAEECHCGEVIAGRRETHGRTNASSLVAGLNDQSLIRLRQIFLDCKDSLSSFRFAVFLSSKFTPFSYKFVIGKKVLGKSKLEYVLDVCVYSRSTDDLVAIGIQNNDAEKRTSDAKSLRKFVTAIEDIVAEHPSVRSAYYASSYGYALDPSRFGTITQKADTATKVEVKFLEFRDGLYSGPRRIYYHS